MNTLYIAFAIISVSFLVISILDSRKTADELHRYRQKNHDLWMENSRLKSEVLALKSYHDRVESDVTAALNRIEEMEEWK
jgi:hypothetical protein